MNGIKILNYFSRSRKRKQHRKEIQDLQSTIRYLLYQIKVQENWRSMYNDLIERLENVPKECALKDPTIRHHPYILHQFAIQDYSPFSLPLNDASVMHMHTENVFNATMIIEDYYTSDCIHFELETQEGILHYQYSRKGLAIQPLKQIIKRVTRLMANAWYRKLHKGEK